MHPLFRPPLLHKNIYILSVAIMAIGVALPFTPLGRYLGFTALPALYWPFVAVTLVCYVLLTQAVKAWLVRHRWI